MENRLFNLLVILIAGSLLFLAVEGVYQFKSLGQAGQNQISVSGEGKVFAKPDVALVNVGVNVEGQTTAQVIRSGTEKMNAIIQAIKDAGVEEKDIQTTEYNLAPLYNYTESAGRVFEGYSLTQTAQVKIRDFEKIGDILQKAVAKGGNMTQNLQFTIDDMEKVKQDARAKAIGQAKENAKNLEKESGIKLGKLVNVYENYNPYYPVYDSRTKLGMGGAVESAPMPTVEPGQQEVQVTVSLTYQVR